MSRVKLVFFGANKSRFMNLAQYEMFLRNCSQTDFDSHLAVDIDLNLETLKSLELIVNEINSEVSNG